MYRTKLLYYGALALFAPALLLALGAAGWVRYGVREVCASACQAEGYRFPHEQVEALIAYVHDERIPLAERNQAVWAMGYIPDPRLRAALRDLTPGAGPCDHAHALCRLEVNKALEKQSSPRVAERIVLAMVRD